MSGVYEWSWYHFMKCLGRRSISKASIQLVVPTDWSKNLNKYGWHQPLCVYLLSTWHYLMSMHMTRSSPFIFSYQRQPKYWRQWRPGKEAKTLNWYKVVMDLLNISMEEETTEKLFGWDKMFSRTCVHKSGGFTCSLIPIWKCFCQHGYTCL